MQPIGSKVASVNVGGSNWDLWDGYNGAMRVYSFVAQGQANSLNTDVKQFFTYVANNRGFPINNQYLISKSCNLMEINNNANVYSCAIRH